MDRRTLKNGVIAGAIGGLSEIVFISFYVLIAAKDGWLIARLITETFFPVSVAQGPLGISLGIFIHMFLSLGIGIGFLSLARRLPRAMVYSLAIGLSCLLAIWAINFFVILPSVNRGFISQVPAGIAFFSKGLFGIAMAFYHSTRR